MSKTIAIFGAGTGLGTSVARRFGREGYRIALVGPGFGPVMAAARNHIYSLHGELAGEGIYAGTLSVSAMIERSASHEALTSGDLSFEIPGGGVLPVGDPDDLAEQYWELFTKRDRVEAILPAPAGLAA